MHLSSDKIADTETDSSPADRRTVESMARNAERSDLADRELVEWARKLLRARMKLAKLVPKGLFHDSAWDIMLELFISGEEGGVLHVKQLMIASGESSAAAMRRIDRLEEAVFIARTPDSLDHRRVIVQLTERGRTAMIAMLQHIFGSKAVDPGQPRAIDGTPIPFTPRG